MAKLKIFGWSITVTFSGNGWYDYTAEKDEEYSTGQVRATNLLEAFTKAYTEVSW